MSYSKCWERHLFKPFSSGDSGATTEQTRELTMLPDTLESSPVLPSRWTRRSLSFEHSDEGVSDGGASVRQVLRTVMSLRGAHEIDRPQLFNKLLHQMRKLKLVLIPEKKI